MLARKEQYMKVTEVFYNPLKEQKGNLVGFAAITIDNALVIKGLKVVSNKDGDLFVSYPSTLNAKDNKYYDDVFCTDKELRKHIQEEVLTAIKYQKRTKK